MYTNLTLWGALQRRKGSTTLRKESWSLSKIWPRRDTSLGCWVVCVLVSGQNRFGGSCLIAYTKIFVEIFSGMFWNGDVPFELFLRRRMSCHVCARIFMKYMRCGGKSRHSGSYGGSLYQMESKTYISVMLKIRFEIGVSICCFLCVLKQRMGTGQWLEWGCIRWQVTHIDHSVRDLGAAKNLSCFD